MPTPRSIVCTVFERDYHHGVAALVNSLYAMGYRGEVYAGYRGPLPPWAATASMDAEGNADFVVADGLSIHFAYLATEEMLANIKPELIQEVWDYYGDDLDNVFYIDCDIVAKAAWHHFEDWADFGVALCEDMNSPVATTHPIRKKWQRYYAKFGIDYRPQDDVYVNGGFVGLNRRYRDFAGLWQRLQDYMKEHTGKQDRIGIEDRWNMFHYMDQDALNVAKDLTPHISVMGRSAMDFGAHGYIMSHAAGRRKPWHKAFIREILQTGDRPSFTDKVYWRNVAHPIRLFSDGQIRRKQTAIKLAAFVGRIFTRM